MDVLKPTLSSTRLSVTPRESVGKLETGVDKVCIIECKSHYSLPSVNQRVDEKNHRMWWFINDLNGGVDGTCPCHRFTVAATGAPLALVWLYSRIVVYPTSTSTSPAPAVVVGVRVQEILPRWQRVARSRGHQQRSQKTNFAFRHPLRRSGWRRCQSGDNAP